MKSSSYLQDCANVVLAPRTARRWWQKLFWVLTADMWYTVGVMTYLPTIPIVLGAILFTAVDWVFLDFNFREWHTFQHMFSHPCWPLGRITYVIMVFFNCLRLGATPEPEAPEEKVVLPRRRDRRA